jgi:hypothetical protein
MRRLALRLTAVLALIALILPNVGCDSRPPVPGTTATPPVTGPSPVEPRTLVGQVHELTPAGRVPAADFPLVGVIAPAAGGWWRYEQTRTDAGGHYSFTGLPAGTAVVLAASTAHQQVCGALSGLNATTRLDVEVTSRANPQKSPAAAPLRVTGRIYEMTPAGPVGVSQAGIEVLWYSDALLLSVLPDAHGYYTACGIPANRLVLFDILSGGAYEVVSQSFPWREFAGDTTLDIELKRVK